VGYHFFVLKDSLFVEDVMKKLLCMVMFLMVSPFSYAQTQYTILAEDAAGLWGQADGTGAGNDIVRAAFAAMGDKVIFKIVPYNRCKTYVMNARALACFGMGWSDEFKGKVTFSAEPIYTNTATIFVRKTDVQKYKSISDVRPKSKVGTVLGYEYPPAFMRLLQAETFLPDDALSEVLSLKKLVAGRFDFVVANLDDLKSAQYLLEEAGVANEVQTAFSMDKSGTFLGFSVGVPQTPAALKTFDAGMQVIKRDGTLERILEAWKVKQISKKNR
jgi:polar amino acid transport system substrate-binding protein